MTQFVAGRELDEEGFRLWGLAMSIAGIVLTIRTAGIRDILVQRGDEYPDLSRPAMHVGLAFSMLAVLILGSTAPLFERWFKADGLAVMLWVITLSMPLGVPPRIYNAKLGIDLRFQANQIIIAINNILRQGTAITLLLLGYGPVSLVWPMVITAVFEWIATRWLTGPLPPSTRKASLDTYKSLLAASKWIVLGIFGAVLIDNLDNIVIDMVVVGPIMGVYFFAYRLTLGFFRLFKNSLANVMMPSLAKLTSLGVDRQRSAYERSGRSLVLVCGPMCIVLALFSGPAIHLLWDGRWDSAIVPTQIMALSLVTRMHGPLGISLAAARGAWRRRALLLIGDGIGTGLAALVGSLLGGLVVITLVISLYRFLSGPLIYQNVGSTVRVKLRHTLFEVLLPATVVVALGVGSHYTAVWLGYSYSHLIALGIYAVAAGGFAFGFQAQAIRDIKSVVLNRRAVKPGS